MREMVVARGVAGERQFSEVSGFKEKPRRIDFLFAADCVVRLLVRVVK